MEGVCATMSCPPADAHSKELFSFFPFVFHWNCNRSDITKKKEGKTKSRRVFKWGKRKTKPPGGTAPSCAYKGYYYSANVLYIARGANTSAFSFLFEIYRYSALKKGNQEALSNWKQSSTTIILLLILWKITRQSRVFNILQVLLAQCMQDAERIFFLKKESLSYVFKCGELRMDAPFHIKSLDWSDWKSRQRAEIPRRPHRRAKKRTKIKRV